jgi:hypothetical protein
MIGCYPIIMLLLQLEKSKDLPIRLLRPGLRIRETKLVMISFTDLSSVAEYQQIPMDQKTNVCSIMTVYWIQQMMTTK